MMKIARPEEPRLAIRTERWSRLSARRPATMLVAGVWVAVAALLLAACSGAGSTSSAAANPSGPASGKPSGTLVVFAAASLNAAFDKIGTQFEKANPGVTVKFNFAGSSSLVTSSGRMDEAIALSLILVLVSLVVMIFRRERSGAD